MLSIWRKCRESWSAWWSPEPPEPLTFRIVADMRGGPRVIKASGLREDQIDEMARLTVEFYKDEAVLNLALEPEDLPFDPSAPFSPSEADLSMTLG